MEHGFFHPDRGYWQAIGIDPTPYTVVVEPERVEQAEVDEEIVEITIPAVTRETSQLAELLASYPEGTVEVPLKPGADHQWDGTEWVHTPPDPAEILAAERARMVCSRFQARAALHAAGLLDQVQAAVDQADPFVRLAWADAVEFRRTSPTVLALAQTLGLSDAQVDEVFRAAMRIEA